MEIKNTQRLSLQQKIQLALSVFAIYWPIRLYVNLDHFDWQTLGHNWLLWVVEVVVTVLSFTFG